MYFTLTSFTTVNGYVPVALRSFLSTVQVTDTQWDKEAMKQTFTFNVPNYDTKTLVQVNDLFNTFAIASYFISH